MQQLVVQDVVVVGQVDRVCSLHVAPASTRLQTAQIHRSVAVAHLDDRLRVGERRGKVVDESLRRRNAAAVQAVDRDAQVALQHVVVASLLDRLYLSISQTCNYTVSQNETTFIF